MNNTARGLGRGLSALIPAAEGQGTGSRQVAIGDIRPNPRQPRELFDETELAELAASIREVGILQPLVVRPAEDGYELVAGERRLRAARLAGLDRVPVVIRHTEDTELLREALIENIHRAQLNPLEEAAAYRQLIEDLDVTHEELAHRLGKSRPTITNALRLLGLPAGVQRRIAAGVLAAGHAKALLSVEDPELQLRLAERVVNEGLSVRATEELARVTRGDERSHGRRRDAAPSRRAPGLRDLEERLSDALTARVRVDVGERRGRLTIEFGGPDELARVVGVIAAGLGVDVPIEEQPL